MGLCRTISLVPGTQQQQFPSATPGSHTLSRGYLVECCATSAQLCHYQLSVVLAARWRVSVSSAPTLPSLGLAHMLISAINDRGNMPKETRHFLSFNLIYVFFLKNCSEKTPCLIHWWGQCKNGCAHLCLATYKWEQEPWMQLSFAWPLPHHTRGYIFLFYSVVPGQGLGLGAGHRSTSGAHLCDFHHCSLTPAMMRQMWVHLRPGITLHSPSEAMLQDRPGSTLRLSFPSPQYHFFIVITSSQFWAAGQGATRRFLALESWSHNRWQDQRQPGLARRSPWKWARTARDELCQHRGGRQPQAHGGTWAAGWDGMAAPWDEMGPLRGSAKAGHMRQSAGLALQEGRCLKGKLGPSCRQRVL